jgi:hypothetical protein
VLFYHLQKRHPAPLVEFNMHRNPNSFCPMHRELLSKGRDAELLDLLSRREMYTFLYPLDA